MSKKSNKGKEEMPFKFTEKKGRNPRTPYHKDCTCCPVHYTWTDMPIPKHEVTIEHIARVNKLYRKLHELININSGLIKLLNERVDRNMVLSEETANFLLIIGKGDDCTQRYGTESRAQFQKLLDLTIEKEEE